MKKGMFPPDFTLDEVETALFGERGTIKREAYELEKQDELIREEQKLIIEQGCI